MKQVDFCHMTITLDGSERQDQEFRQWKTLFEQIERESRKLDYPTPIIESVPVSRDKWLSTMITGHDLFIGLYDKQKNEMTSLCRFDEVKRVTSEYISRLTDDVKGVSRNEINHNPEKLAPLWGKQMVIRLSKENNMDDRIKCAQARKCLEKMIAKPIDMIERKVSIDAYLQR